jgi:glycosyltransferase involved in cell wall biosynthesis
MMQKPKVSCYCATYGRVNLLEESLQSFLIQDYQGEKELIILNDFPDQTIYFNHPQVKIYNHKKKESLLGKKFNDCVKYCTGEILFPWEDDDIYLSNKISFSVNKMISNNKRIFHTNNAFYELSFKNIINAFDYFQSCKHLRIAQLGIGKRGQRLHLLRDLPCLNARHLDYKCRTMNCYLELGSRWDRVLHATSGLFLYQELLTLRHLCIAHLQPYE